MRLLSQVVAAAGLQHLPSSNLQLLLSGLLGPSCCRCRNSQAAGPSSSSGAEAGAQPQQQLQQQQPPSPTSSPGPQQQQRAGAGSTDILALFRRHNFSLPAKGHVIAAKVIQVTKDSVLVDPGYFGLCEFSRSQLSVDQLVLSSGEAATQRHSRHDIRPGDLLKFKLEDFFSPYGDMQLEPVHTAADVKSGLLWRELQRAFENIQPVPGRILNACNGGFAVGVGGYVCLLPFSKARPETARLVGVLQQFYIERMVHDTRTVILRESQHSDAADVTGVYSNIPAKPPQ